MVSRREVLGAGLHQAAVKLGEALPDIPKLDPEVFNLPTSRRQLLILTGFGLTNALLIACRPKDHPQPQMAPEEEEYKKLSEITPALTKLEIRNLLENLPASPYKDFVMRFGYPFFQDYLPVVTLGNERITVWDSTVTDITSEQSFGGAAKIRSGSKVKSMTLKEDHTFILPLPYIADDQPGQPNFQIQGDYKQGDVFTEGIAPEVKWYYQKNGILPSKRVESYLRLREFIIVKEAFGIAFYIAYLAEIAQSGHTLGLPFYFYDNGQKLEGLSQSFLDAIYASPRLLAILDIGPLIIAAKAMQSNRVLIGEFRKLPENTRTLDAISTLDFGSKPEEMVAETIKFILKNKQLVTGVSHNGQLDPFP